MLRAANWNVHWVCAAEQQLPRGQNPVTERVRRSTGEQSEASSLIYASLEHGCQEKFDLVHIPSLLVLCTP